VPKHPTPLSLTENAEEGLKVIIDNLLKTRNIATKLLLNRRPNPFPENRGSMIKDRRSRPIIGTRGSASDPGKQD
jgi:hypothetical protein